MTRLRFAFLIALVAFPTCAGCLLFAPPKPAPVAPPPAMPAPNPWLADGAAPIAYANPAATGAVLTGGPLTGKRLVRSTDAKVVWNLFAAGATGRKIDTDTVLFASGALGIRKIFATGSAFERLAFLPYPGFEARATQAGETAIAERLVQLDAARRARDDAALLTAIAGLERLGVTAETLRNGGASFVDTDGFHYCTYGGAKVLKSTDDGLVRGPLRIAKTIDLARTLARHDAGAIGPVLGLAMTYDGHLVAAASRALVVLDRELQVRTHLVLDDEATVGGVALDERNGIYLVTSRRMRKIVWTGTRLSTDEADGAWVSPLPDDPARASSPPALLGFGDDPDKLVVVADHTAAGATLLAFWRDAIPAGFVPKRGAASPRTAGERRIDVAYRTIAAPPTVLGDGIAVVSGAHPQPASVFALPNAFTAGVTRPAPLGIQKLVWNAAADRFDLAWTNAELDGGDGAAPVVSWKTGLLYAAHKVNGDYQYVGLDWRTGAIRERWSFPDDSALWNAFGGHTTILENGDLLLGGAFALKRVVATTPR